jgi:hypothetical protein
VCHERTDIAHDRRIARQPVGLVDAGRRCRCDVREIDALVHGDRSIGLHSLFEQHPPDGFRGAEESTHLPVLPAGERVGSEVEVDAARHHQDRMWLEGLVGQRNGCHGRAVGIVGVHDGGPNVADDARQPPGGREVELGTRRERDEVGSLGRTPAQLALRVCDEHRTMTERAQTEDGQQCLVLPATPRPCGVDVEGEHKG